MSKSGKKVILGGKGASLTPRDVFNVAALGYTAEVDSAALEKLQKHADARGSDKGPKGTKSGKDSAGATSNGNPQEPPKVTTDPRQGKPAPKESLGREHARAAVLVRLLEVVASGVPGAGQAAPLAEFYAALLNGKVDLLLPQGPMDASVLHAIHRAAAGQGYAGSWQAQGPNAEAKSGLELQEALKPGAGGVPVATPPFQSPSPGLKADSMAPTAGIAALAAYQAASLLTVTDAVAALSCEALQADVTPITEGAGGEGQQHKWGQDVASDLRSLLQGSKCVNPRKGAAVLRSVLAVPQSHGALREAAKATASAVRVELNPSAEAGGNSEGKAGKGGSAAALPFVPSFFVAGALCSLLRSLGLVASCSVKRSQQLLQAIRELEEQFGESKAAGTSQPRAADAWASTLRPDTMPFWILEVGTLVDSIKTNAAEMARVVALGDIGDEGTDVALDAPPASQALSSEAPSRAGFSMAKLDSMALSRGVPSVAAAVAATTSADRLRTVLALESVLALRLLALREAVQASRVSGGGGKGEKEGKGKEGKQGKGGGGPGGIVLGKGSALLREELLQILEGPEGGGDPWGAVQDALDPRGASLENLEQKLRGAIESNEVRRAPKIAKGTRDFLPDQMAIRERAFAIISAVFKRHGAVALDTPVFELRETLTGKYGEDSKLIYDLADQGGEILSLRYDLTVPFARYLAMHNVGNIKRYHIARVYRRDNPQMSRGRYREFYQCDYDVAGQYAPMVPDSEVLKVVTELLDELEIGDYEIKLNHRRLLDGMLAICGVPSSKFRAICSAVDKLDKEPWEAVRDEMVNEKGLPGPVANRIGEFVVKRGKPLELIAELRAPGSPFAGHKDSEDALGELALLFEYLQAMGALHRIVFDLSLARGLDYYTGVIYEAVFTGSSQVGSIAAGGRYDNLVGMFSGKQVPAVGVSLGIERVFTIMEEKERSKNQLIRSTQTEVLVASIGPDLLKRRMEVATTLWKAGIKAEFVMAAAPNMQRQLEFANKAGIPWMVLFGSSELEKGEVKVKDLLNRTEEDVKMDNLVEFLRPKLQ